jgi:hypothetical protein
MDFRSEIEQHASMVKNKVDKQLQEIHQLQENVVTLEDRISGLQTEITHLKTSLAPQIQELAAKKELLAQWQSALDEHKNSLLANQMLINMQESIEKNHARIEGKLDVLEKEKSSILASIQQFHIDHPYMNKEIESRVKTELAEKKTRLEQVSEQILQIEAMQTKLNVIVKIFLNLLYSWGWADPLEEEKKVLLQIKHDIEKITDTLDEYQRDREELNTLYEQDEQISNEKRKLLDEKAQVQQIEATKKAIAESKQTIKQLSQKIQNTQSECRDIQKQISNKKLDKIVGEQQALVREKNEKMFQLREKSEHLSEIDSPNRAASKTVLTDALIQIITHQERYIQDQEVYRSTHSTTQFFKPRSGTDRNQATHGTPNFVALSKLQQAIKTYKDGLTPEKSEYRLLSQIGTKLLLWQMAEDSTNLKMTMEERHAAHNIFNTEIAGLVADLPPDNPLHASLHFIETLTQPLEPAEEASIKTTKRIK